MKNNTGGFLLVVMRIGDRVGSVAAEVLGDLA